MIVPFSMKLWCLNEELVRFVSPYTGAQSPTRVWFSKWVCMISTFRKSVCPLNWHAFELYAYAYARGMLLKKRHATARVWSLTADSVQGASVHRDGPPQLDQIPYLGKGLRGPEWSGPERPWAWPFAAHGLAVESHHCAHACWSHAEVLISEYFGCWTSFPVHSWLITRLCHWPETRSTFLMSKKVVTKKKVERPIMSNHVQSAAAALHQWPGATCSCHFGGKWYSCTSSFSLILRIFVNTAWGMTEWPISDLHGFGVSTCGQMDLSEG